MCLVPVVDGHVCLAYAMHLREAFLLHKNTRHHQPRARWSVHGRRSTRGSITLCPRSHVATMWNATFFVNYLISPPETVTATLYMQERLSLPRCASAFWHEILHETSEQMHHCCNTHTISEYISSCLNLGHLSLGLELPITSVFFRKTNNSFDSALDV